MDIHHNSAAIFLQGKSTRTYHEFFKAYCTVQQVAVQILVIQNQPISALIYCEVRFGA